jgi:HD-like signal output (HDOD) protein
MISLLFVDDDPNVGAGLQRTLHGMRDSWDMRFALSGSEALKMMTSSPADIIVTDMRMPEMDGAQLLAEIERLYPQTARIILSGQCDRQTALRAVGPTHLFLPKPCDRERLIEVILRVHRLRAILTERRIADAVSGLRDLPSAPSLHHELLEALSSPEVSVQKLAEIIQWDIALTAKLLQLVNSAFFGARWHVTTALQAVNLLGTELVHTLIVTLGIVRQVEEGRSGRDFDRCWKHGMRTASGARFIAGDLGMEKRTADEAFTAGLLHDVGRLILSTLPGDNDRQIDRLCHEEGAPRSEIERRQLGATHAEIGAYLLALWGLPDRIIEATAFHHEPARSGTKLCVTTAVHAASALASGTEEALDGDYLEEMGVHRRVDHWKREFVAQAWGAAA